MNKLKTRRRKRSDQQFPIFKEKSRNYENILLVS